MGRAGRRKRLGSCRDVMLGRGSKLDPHCAEGGKNRQEQRKKRWDDCGDIILGGVPTSSIVLQIPQWDVPSLKDILDFV